MFDFNKLLKNNNTPILIFILLIFKFNKYKLLIKFLLIFHQSM